jgi:4-amino-4-deoxy-L-arabinose transferase-like glycosyltransferase
MISFWKAITDGKSSFWNYLFFIALGLGILSKGFIVLPLTGLPILTWLLIHKVRIKKVLNALPWLIGIFIVAGITIPWFVLMEIRSPGFIDYFIIGEHFNRFLNAGWQGDLYGEGHSHPPGMIWVFLMLFAFPWIQIVLYKLWKERTSIIKDKWVSFLAIWLLWTPIFFTFSRNILHTYILPVMAPMALLMVCWWDNFKNKKYLILTGSVFPVLVVLALTAFVTNESLKSYINSDKYLLSKLSTVKSEFATPLYYYNEKSFSGQFYSGGYAQAVANPKELDSVMELNDPFNLVILKKYLDSIPASVKPHLHHLDSNYKISVFLVK